MSIEELNNYIRDGGDPDYASIQLDPTKQKIWSMVNINLNIPYASQPGAGHNKRWYWMPDTKKRELLYWWEVRHGKRD